MSEQERVPQTGLADLNDVASREWLLQRHESEIGEIEALFSRSQDAPSAGTIQGTGAARLAEPLDPIDSGPRPRPTGGGTSVAQPLSSFYAYVNSRPGKDWNTCGQAAVASMLDFNGKDLGLPRQWHGHWDHGDAIDKVSALGYGPDVVFGWGTTPNRIRDALVRFGIQAEVGHSGLFFSGWTTEWNKLLAYVYYSAIPVPVLVDMGLLGGPHLGAHWPVLWKMEKDSSGMMLHFGNWDTEWLSQPIPSARFIDAWACRHLPLGFNHAAVYTGRPRVSF